MHAEDAGVAQHYLELVHIAEEEDAQHVEEEDAQHVEVVQHVEALEFAHIVEEKAVQRVMEPEDVQHAELDVETA